jgi:hypothetical protein
MTSITVKISGIRDEQTLRRGLTAHSRTVRAGVPEGIVESDCEGMAFVGNDGIAWRMKSVRLYPDQAARLAAVVAGYGEKPVLASYGLIASTLAALLNGTDQARAEAADELGRLLHVAETFESTTTEV